MFVRKRGESTGKQKENEMGRDGEQKGGMLSQKENVAKREKPKEWGNASGNERTKKLEEIRKQKGGET